MKNLSAFIASILLLSFSLHSLAGTRNSFYDNVRTMSFGELFVARGTELAKIVGKCTLGTVATAGSPVLGFGAGAVTTIVTGKNRLAMTWEVPEKVWHDLVKGEDSYCKKSVKRMRYIEQEITQRTDIFNF